MRAAFSLRVLALAGTCFVPATASAQAGGSQPLAAQVQEALRLIRAQQQRLDAQADEIRQLRARLDGPVAANAASGAVPPSAVTPPAAAVASASATDQAATPAVAVASTTPLERVGRPPEDEARPIELAVLDMQGSIVTRKGQLTAEFQADYTRADRNRAVFRGIELVEAVLVGVFDINESRQDILTASAGLRYGVTDRLELGVRVPFVHRADTSIIAPIMGSTSNDDANTIDSSTKSSNIGDLELTARYQLLDGTQTRPYLIANLQGVLPTGTDPFAVPRDSSGRALRAATGAGFYGITPSVTAILPSDPVVLFGTLGYTFNLGKSVDTVIDPVRITYVDPGDAISASVGIGISFNQRTTVNLGYAHSWAFGTLTRTSLLMPTEAWPGSRDATSRDLQIGRFLFGVTYRTSDRSTINWAVEVGATEDAPDLRTVLRIPITL